MLTEIYCEAFGEQKKVLFSPGLNVIQGYAQSVADSIQLCKRSRGE